MKKYAFIDLTTGAALNIRVPAQTPLGWGDNVMVGDLLCKEIPIDSVNGDYLTKKYWKDNAWHDRGSKPSPEHKWTADGWSYTYNREKEWNKIIGERDNLLKLSDWTQGLDSPLTEEKKAEFRVYRQTLRDLPATQSSAQYIQDIVWPTGPSKD